MLQNLRSKRADTDPRAGSQLEILRETSVVAEALLLVSRFGPVQRIAGSQKSVFVEGVEGEIGSLPIARRYARALNP